MYIKINEFYKNLKIEDGATVLHDSYFKKLIITMIKRKNSNFEIKLDYFAQESTFTKIILSINRFHENEKKKIVSILHYIGRIILWSILLYRDEVTHRRTVMKELKANYFCFYPKNDKEDDLKVRIKDYLSKNIRFFEVNQSTIYNNIINNRRDGSEEEVIISRFLSL